MEFLISIAMGAPTLSQKTVLFALIPGLIIGTVISLTEIGSAYVARKLRISEEEAPLKYFSLIVVVGGAIALLSFMAMQALGPSREQTEAMSDRTIDELGIDLYLGLGALGSIAAVVPLRLLSNRITSKEE